MIASAAALLAACPAVAAAPRALELPQAIEIVHVPTVVHGSTKGSVLRAREPHPWCAASKGAVWYTFRALRHAPIVLRLDARDKLEATLAVYHHVRSSVTRITCVKTNSLGHASVSLYASRRGTYLVAVARRSTSANGRFALRVLVAERPARPPGQLLPRGGVRSTLNPVLDPSDSWSVDMKRGTTYRFNVSSHGCMVMQLYRPGIYSFATARPVLETNCGGYETFTPGPDGGGRYTIRMAPNDGGIVTRDGYLPSLRA